MKLWICIFGLLNTVIMNNRITSIIILLLISIHTMAQNYDTVNISCQKTYALITEHKNDPDFLILDLRTKEMFDSGHIENACFFDVFAILQCRPQEWHCT